MAQEIHIKNMVCPRCVMAVKSILSSLGIETESVELGTAVLREPLAPEQKKALEAKLNEYGFELLDDRRRQLVDKIATSVIELVRSDAPESVKVNLSEYLAERCGASYSLLSKLFTEVKGISIEKYYILQKVEMVKELLVYNELSVSEIAFRMGYSGVAHLSSQFKSVTGLTPSQFRKVEGKRRSLDAI